MEDRGSPSLTSPPTGVQPTSQYTQIRPLATVHHNVDKVLPKLLRQSLRDMSGVSSGDTGVMGNIVTPSTPQTMADPRGSMKARGQKPGGVVVPKRTT